MSIHNQIHVQVCKLGVLTESVLDRIRYRREKYMLKNNKMRVKIMEIIKNSSIRLSTVEKHQRWLL